MDFAFEWDTEKARANLRKHGVTFETAVSAFFDPFSITIPDPDHSAEEARFVLIGRTWQDILVLVVHTPRRDRIRIISARRAVPAERRIYEEDQG